MALQSTSGIKAGDVLAFWHDTGAFGATLNFARVLKPCTKMLRVRDEHGNEALRYPWFFDRVISPKAVDELRAEGVRI